jgi:4-carboxymuconolactone decarboxylase
MARSARPERGAVGVHQWSERARFVCRELEVAVAARQAALAGLDRGAHVEQLLAGAAASPLAQAASAPLPSATAPDDVRAVSPALHDYSQRLLAGEVWKRPGLAPRDRSLIPVAALVARNQTAEMAT